MFNNFITYITTIKYRTTLYIGMTNNIQNRLSQHYFDNQNEKLSFAGKYDCIYLVYYEGFEFSNQVVLSEEQLKKWR